MSVLIHHLPPPSANCLLRQSEDCPIAQGPEGKLVRGHMESVHRNGHALSREYLSETEDELLDELNNYRHVPFERVGTRLVRYVRVTDLLPRKFDLDENDE